MSTPTLEDRAAKLDEELASIKRELAASKEEEPTWKQMIGVFKDCPDFEESVRLGREWRESQNLIDDEEAASSDAGQH